MSDLVERLAEKWDAFCDEHDTGDFADEQDVRWWLTAIADELDREGLETDNRLMRTTWSGDRPGAQARQWAYWLRSQAGDTS